MKKTILIIALSAALFGAIHWAISWHFSPKHVAVQMMQEYVKTGGIKGILNTPEEANPLASNFKEIVTKIHDEKVDHLVKCGWSRSEAENLTGSVDYLLDRAKKHLPLE